MMRSQRLRLFTVLVSMGCSNSLAAPGGGGNVVGTWQAVSVNNLPLPVDIPSQPYRCPQKGLGGSLDVRGDGRFTGIYRYEVDCSPYGKGTEERQIAGWYTSAGTQIVFTADSGFNRSETVPQVVGVVNGSVLTVQSTPAPGMSVMMAFQRR